MHRSSCSCDHHYQPNSFSMLFTMPPNYHHHHQNICPYSSSSSSSGSVDCTLSLATPAALHHDDYDSPESRGHSSRFCWDFLQPDNNSLSPAAPPPSQKSNRGGVTNSSGAGDSLLARRCANCDTTSTPLWRNGPRGPKSLCNACGIRFKKEERRAATTTTTAVPVVGIGGDENHNGWMHNSKTTSSWYSPAAAAMAVGSEYSRYRGDDVDDRDSTFLSWRLNVTDRPGLVHDFTRY